MARLLTLRAMLKLEMRGMHRSKSPSALSMLRSMGYTGSREKILEQLDAARNEMLGEMK
jgi:hypothetical protein